MIEVRDVKVGFGDHLVLDGVDLDVYRGEILGFVGGSGAGKSVLMRTIIGLLPKRGGTIKVFGAGHGQPRATPSAQAVERRWGVLFQQGALFSSLTVQENLQFPMREYLQSVAAADGRTGARQARNGRARRQRARQDSRPNCPAA